MKPMVQLNVRVEPCVKQFLEELVAKANVYSPNKRGPTTVQSELERILRAEMARVLRDEPERLTRLGAAAAAITVPAEVASKQPAAVVRGPQLALVDQFGDANVEECRRITNEELNAVLAKNGLFDGQAWVWRFDRWEARFGLGRVVPEAHRNSCRAVLASAGYIAKAHDGGTKTSREYYVAVHGRVASKQPAKRRRGDRRRGGARLNDPSTWPKALHAQLDREVAAAEAKPAKRRKRAA